MAQSSVEYPESDVADLTEEAPIRVLHVDDEAGFLKAAKQILEMQGNFQVETASSVEEAMEKMRKREFDIIASDYIMPEKSGLEFLKELRESGNNIPFILFTGKGREEVAIEALNLGADHYINKIGKPETVYYELAHGIRRAVERKKTYEIIKRVAAEWEKTFDAINDMVFILDNEHRFVRANKATYTVLKKESEELIGKHCFEVLHGTDKVLQNCPYEKMFVTKKPETKEYYDTVSDRTFFLSVSPLYDDNGEITGGMHIVRDITERKKTEEALKESEEKYKHMVELAPDSIITANMKGVVTSVNTMFTRLTGFSKDEIVGKHFTKVGTIRKRDLPMLLKVFTSLLRGKALKPFEVMWKHKDGTIHPTEIHVMHAYFQIGFSSHNS